MMHFLPSVFLDLLGSNWTEADLNRWSEDERIEGRDNGVSTTGGETHSAANVSNNYCRSKLSENFSCTVIHFAGAQES